MNRWRIATSVGVAIGMVTASAALAQEAEYTTDESTLEADGFGEDAHPDQTGSQNDTDSVAQSENAREAAQPRPIQPYEQTIPVPRPEAPPEPKQTRRERQQVEEIIVTAQRRQESAQDVAISMTVFNQDALNKANIVNSSDLATYTPSLSSNQRFGPENASFSIRGFTQDLRTTASVATYFAEVVAPRGQSSQTSGDGAGPGMFFDLENVQVLKGPQGTLFGRNTTGGAILVVPRKPSDQFEGYLEASGGDFSARQIQGVVNVPLADWFRLRLGVDHKQREGHLNNVTGIGADDLGNVDYTAARLSLVLDITDALENYTILSYVDSDTHGYTTRLFDCNTSFDPEHPNPFALFTRQPCQQQLADQEASGRNDYYDIVSTVQRPITAIREKRLINTTTWQFADNVAFKNILAYSHLHTLNESNIFGTQFPDPTDPRREFSVGASVLNPDSPVTSQEALIEEIQFQGNAFDGQLNWQAGAYYENSRPDGFSGNTAASFLYCDLGSLSGDPSDYNCFDPLAGLLGGVLVQEYKTEYLNKAVYAQATYELNEYFNATGGIRYTWDEAEGYGIKTRYAYLLGIQQPPVTTITTPRVKSEAPTGMVELQYRPVDGTMTYVKYTHGYRQGSVNLAADSTVDTHDPEKVDTYEIGAKTQFGGPLPGRFNLAAFYNDFTDMQLQFGYISTTGGPTTSIANAGKAEIKGFEAELFLQPFDGLSLSASYSYLDTRLKEQDQEAQCARIREIGTFEGFTCTPIADVGDSLPFAPRHSAVGGLNYALPLSSVGTLSLGATYVYTGAQRAAATSSTPYAVLDSYSLLNLNLSWTGIFELPLDFSVIATNVLDEEYVTYVGGTYNVLGIESRGMGLPRMIGARLRYNFGAAAYR